MLDVYGIITERIVAALDEGTVPWNRPWDAAAGAPRNAISRKAYRGINVWLLGMNARESNYWLSYKQATEAGGNVRRGEKSSIAIFWKIDSKKGEPDESGEETVSRRFLLRYYNLFNVDQCDMPEKFWARLKPPTRPEWNPIEECERVVAGMPNAPAIEHRGSLAFYRPSTDSVTMPKRGDFNTDRKSVV